MLLNPPAGLAQEQSPPPRGRRHSANCGRPRSTHAFQRDLAGGDEPCSRPLPDAHLLAVVVDVAEAQRHQLLGAQAQAVPELEHRPVAQLQRSARGDRVQQRGGLARFQFPWAARARAWRGHQLGRVLRDQPVLALAAGTGRAAPRACARSCSAQDRARTAPRRRSACSGLKRPARGGPGGELLQIDLVGAHGPGSRVAAAQPVRPAAASARRPRCTAMLIATTSMPA